MARLALPARRFLAELRRRSVFQVGAAWLVAGWLLIQVASTVAPQFELPAWVPRAVTLGVLLGFPVALLLAWAFEFGPAGLHRDTKSRNTRLVVAIAGALAVGALGWFFRDSIGEQEPGARRIAVLPFANLAAEPDSDYLADGLAEELLGALGRNPAFRVTARSSAFQFKGQNRDLREIGQKLGVRYILEGSVRMAAERVRIGAQLVDTEDGTQLWSETYERRLADLFTLEKDIAYQVERALEVVLVAGGQHAPRGTASVEAHLELLRALQIGASRAVRDLDQAIAHLQRAIALDPEYAMAYEELAYAIHTRALQLGEEQQVQDAIAPLLDKALAIDPQLGEALVLRGSLLVADPVQAEQTIRAGLALVPSHARGYSILAEQISDDPARGAEALALLDRAIALDPLAPRNYYLKALFSGDSEIAAGLFRKALEVEPRYRLALLQLSLDCMARGRFAEAVDYNERALALDPSTPGLREQLARQYLNIGDPAAARAVNEPAMPAIALNLALYANDSDTAMALLRENPQLAHGQGWNTIIAALRHARAHGSWAEDLAFAKQALDYHGTLPPGPIAWDFAHATLVALLRGSGAVAEADALAAELARRQQEAAPDETGWARGPASWQRAMLASQAGNTAEALDQLERAFEPSRPYWWALLDNSPVFDPLRAEPRYRALRERLEHYLEAQRAELAELRRKRPNS